MTKQEFVNRVMPVKDKLFRLARRILNETDAEDVVQEAFVKLWSKQAEISAYRSVEAFAMVVTKNLCLDKIKSKAYQTGGLDEWNAPVDYKSPDKMTELKNDVEMAHLAIASLPELQRMIIQLRDVEEMEYEEISEVLQMNLNAIRVNLSRARKAVRDQLKKMHDYEYNGN
ncbi:MAG: RNA polymerase sigma factor [Bacteroidales bacterium]|nr:RNA polymerase sigma factor [Bacteroidales bacterium]